MKDKEKYYFLSPDNEVVGPFLWKDLKGLGIKDDTNVLCDGINKWLSYKEFKNKRHKVNRRKILTALGCFFIIAIVSCFIIFRDRTHDLLKENSYECNEFDMYLEKYYRDIEFFGISKVKSKTVIIRMAPMQYFESTKDYHGVSFGCDNDELIEIYINEDSWNKFSKSQRFWLMYHELSHDILNLDDESENSCVGNHLMSPFISTFNKISMDDFIEASHDLFGNYSD